MIEDLVKAMRDDIDMVVAGQRLQYYNKNGIVKIKEYKYPRRELDTKNELLKFIFNTENDAASQHIWNCLYRRDIIKNHSLYFDEYFKHGLEDFAFNMIYANHCSSVVEIPAIVYEYRSRTGISTSTKLNDDAIEDVIYLLNLLETEFANKEDEAEPIIDYTKQTPEIMNSDKLEALGWKANVDISEGIKRAVAILTEK